jgi:hypothetical protein
LSKRRALEVLVGLNLLGANESLLIGNRLHSLLAQRLEGGCIFPQIKLGTDENDGNVRRMMINLGVPLNEVR